MQRRQDVEEAYRIQVRAGVRGFAQYGTVAAGLAAIGHHSWPAFRRQTLPLKAWIVTIVGVLGMCLHAEEALQKYELEQRLRENSIRREARIDLARRGLVATETEIAKWKAERARADAAVAEVERAQAAAATSAQPSA
ncbi:hypothetical protein C8Q80DRAFT_1098236 [Daedaleopsis nitida]|nr:hypothetical protein C8Q80DRAFT_1098236 [Daedaleopsis nitida]